jgi:hypothetical protein
MRNDFRILSAFGLVASLVGCTEDVDSTDVKTSGVYADIHVLADGDGSSTLTVGLKVGGSKSNTYLDLKGGDELVATAGDAASQELSQSGREYKATFDTEAGGTKIVVSFNRAEEESAPNSSVVLPDPFELEGIERGQKISRKDTLEITWDAAEESMSAELKGDCLTIESRSFSDSGRFELEPALYDLSAGTEATESCNATLCFDRSQSGKVDAAYGEGGKIVATQRRCVAFMSTP